MAHSLKIGLQASLMVFGAICTTACHDANDTGIEYAPEMYESIPYEPLRQVTANTINPMGINQRTPPVGTVPLGKLDYYDHIPKDSVEQASRRLTNPLAYTQENLVEGQTLYARNCQHCHGEQGDGQGPVGQKFKGVPNYSAGAYKTMNDGHIYHVIEWGKGRMMPHGSQVNPEERWKIAMYVRALQLGEGPDGLSKMVKVGPTSAASDSTETSDSSNQSAVEEAQAGTGSATPGQGNTKATNGTAN
ncbi:c-type cytochrome [Hymenobacter profundi]|uniref:Cytochrome c n=2 Tax=Hymenobacter TaxID=89966 RepID=A0ABS6WYU1_9BACT|nr:cytochrome c [Hymenobacter profundi]MBW3127889.1 cytochrome c [Hymenobacter profundi]